eukprot:SAG31_NODE_1613_length_7743_cov_5.584903_10_plen_68_part_00
MHRPTRDFGHFTRRPTIYLLLQLSREPPGLVSPTQNIADVTVKQIEAKYRNRNLFNIEVLASPFVWA